MWIAVGVVAVVVLMIAVLLRTPRGSSSPDGPLPDDVEAQVLLGEPPPDDVPQSPGPDDDDIDAHDDARP